jgi:uncharacterized membrane protein
MALALALHALAAVLWVGGMFFAYTILRPSVGGMQPKERLELWRNVFARFFPWVWSAVLVLPATGYLMLFGQFGGMAGAGVHVHIMQLTGWLMILLFVHLFFAPWRRFQAALAGGDTAEAARRLGRIRLIVATNLALGLLTVAIASSGRWWG